MRRSRRRASIISSTSSPRNGLRYSASTPSRSPCAPATRASAPTPPGSSSSTPGSSAAHWKGSTGSCFAESGRGHPLFGPACELIRAEALVRLDSEPPLPSGLLALGQREAQGFETRHGSELLDVPRPSPHPLDGPVADPLSGHPARSHGPALAAASRTRSPPLPAHRPRLCGDRPSPDRLSRSASRRRRRRVRSGRSRGEGPARLPRPPARRGAGQQLGRARAFRRPFFPRLRFGRAGRGAEPAPAQGAEEAAKRAPAGRARRRRSRSPKKPARTASEAWIAARDQSVLLLLYGSGLRVAEALGLTGAALPLGESLSVTGKRAKTRMVPLLAPVR